MEPLGVILGLLVALVLAGVGAVYALPVASKRLRARSLRERCVRERALVLTYDDGPSAALTGKVLDLLAEAGARATFFMLGRAAEREPQVADRVAAAGHEIACHSHAHLHAWRVAPWRSLADARHGFATLARWLGPGAMYRPPNGKVTLPTMVALRRRGADLAWWTHDSGDTHDPLPPIGGVVERIEADGGGVVLLHDFDRDAHERAAREAFVLETTRRLLAVAERRGLRVVTMGELVQGHGAASPEEAAS